MDRWFGVRCCVGWGDDMQGSSDYEGMMDEVEYDRIRKGKEEKLMIKSNNKM